MLDAQRFIFERAVHPITHQIYGGVDLEDPHRWENTRFPDKELVDGVTASDSYTPNVSNCAIAGGRFLGVLVDSYAVAPSEACFERARIVFDGLKRLARVSPRKGFIARCCLPVDNETHYLNSSVDQYTYYVYGLWKYYHSPLSGDSEKQDIRTIMEEICSMIVRDGTILASDGTPARVSDIEVIRSDRSSRLLEVFLVGYDITENQHWKEYYEEKLRENRSARLHSLLNPKTIRHPYLPRDQNRDMHQLTGSGNQTQYSLVPLFEMEPEISVKATYLEAMRVHARIYESLPRNSTSSLHVVLLAQNRFLHDSVISPADELYHKALKEKVLQTISRNPKSIGTQEIYWTGIRRGILPDESQP